MITAAEIQMIRNANRRAVLPGIDTKTGNPNPTYTLLDVTTFTPNSKARYFYTPSRNAVYVTQAGTVLSGINFGSASVIVGANNVTIKDCTFTGTTGYYAVEQTSSSSGLTVENSTFTGTKSPTENNVWIGSVQGSMTIKDNSFLSSPSDAIDMHSGVVTGNYFSGAGYWPIAHADAIWVTDSTGPTTITNNFIDGTPNADSPANSNSDIRLTSELGNLSDVTVSGNYLIGGGYTVQAGGTISNVSIANNYIGFGAYGPYYYTTTRVASVVGNTIVDFTNPTDSIRPRRRTRLLGFQRRMWSPRQQATFGPSPADRSRRRSSATVSWARTCRPARAKRTSSAGPVHNTCTAVRASTFSPISP